MSSENKGLWTRDFTIITLGSVISMFGNAMSGFALSLLVLDYTGSTLLYSIYIVLFTLPQIIMPVLFGAWMDRFSRKKDNLYAGFHQCRYLCPGIIPAGKRLVLLSVPCGRGVYRRFNQQRLYDGFSVLLSAADH